MDRAGGRLPESQVIPWVIQVCDALTFLHTQKPPVIHRDIKPANIKITPEGKAVLVDFGIAKAYFGQSQTTLGARAVTEGYSPPEQYGHGTTDVRSDLYSLGATLYHMLTGTAPIESVQRHLDSGLAAPRSINPSISPGMEAAIVTAMDIDMAGRFQRAEDFKNALVSPAAVLTPPVVGSFGYGTLDDTLISPPRQEPFQPPLPDAGSSSKSRLGIIIGAGLGALICVLVVSLGALAGWFSFLQNTPTPTVAIISMVTTEVLTKTTAPTLTKEEESTWTPTPIPSTLTLTPLPPTFTDLPPTRTMTPTEVDGDWQPCQNTYISRIHVDDVAYVSYYPPLRNFVRSSYSLSASKVGSIEPGERVKIIDGPECADFMVWWEIKSLETGLIGWTSEGDKENYWLVPQN